MIRTFRYCAALIVIISMTTIACGKKAPETPAPAPPPPEKPATTPAPPPPPPPPPPAPPVVPTEDELYEKMTNEQVAQKYLADVFFAYDSIELNEAARGALQKNAEFLKRRATARLMIEGHADSRGTNEYNLALGERRADAARDYLVSLGVPADSVTIVSKGEEQPFCSDETETCWQQNRRGHFLVTAK
ncbi:MAG TPA: OmpA family protein [Vicinamibacterales bacterium]|nr:OmpA family protein [Vicinamibacterales bacterium]